MLASAPARSRQYWDLPSGIRNMKKKESLECEMQREQSGGS
jgi:hypothetical protein